MAILLSTVACGGEEDAKAAPTPSANSATESTPLATPTATPARVTPAPATATAVTVDLGNYLFTPGILEVEAGKVARFNLVGDGEPHTFTITKIGVDIPISDAKTTTPIEFIVPSGASGDLELVCEYHKVLGMVGTVRVK